MNGHITIIATSTLLDGKYKDLKGVVEELQEHCRETEPGMLQYDWYILEESNTIKVIECYENSAAVLFHFDNYKPFAPRLGECRQFQSMEVYGPASDKLRQRVKKINAAHYTSFAHLNKGS